MTAQSSIDIQKSLSLQQFIKLLQKLPPARIAELPIEKLPNNIPADISEKIPMASRSAVDDLIMTANSFHLKRRMRDQESYGKHVVAALDKAKTATGSANLRVFKNKILLLVEILQAAQRGTKKVSNDAFVKQINSINNLLIDVRSETINLHDSLSVLEKTKPVNDEDKKRFDFSIQTLKKETVSVGKILAWRNDLVTRCLESSLRLASTIASSHKIKSLSAMTTSLALISLTKS